MRRPSNRTLVLGHLAVAVPVQLLCVFSLAAYWHAGADAMLPAFLTFGVMAETMRAYGEARDYRDWQAAWDSLGETSKRPSRLKNFLGYVLGVGIIVFVGMAQTDDTIAHVGKEILVALAAIYILAVFAKILGRLCRRPRRAMTVTVVATTIMPPVSLADIPALLPEHCQRIMGKE